MSWTSFKRIVVGLPVAVLFECNFRLALCNCLCVWRHLVIIKKSKSENFLMYNTTARTRPSTLYTFWDGPRQRNTDVFLEQKSPTLMRLISERVIKMFI